MNSVTYRQSSLPKESLIDPADSVSDALITFSFSYRLVKRVIDITLSFIILILLAPIFVLIVITICLTSKGSVFYIWNVIGRGGRPFRSYKFRSMVQNADSIKAQLAAHNEMTGPVFKMKDDPRITPIGRNPEKI